MTSPVKRRILANLKPGDDVLVTLRGESGNYGVAGILYEDEGCLMLQPHARLVRDWRGDAPTMQLSVEIIEAAS